MPSVDAARADPLGELQRAATRTGHGTRRMEAWLVPTAVVAGAAYGLLPMLLPQLVVQGGGSALDVGVVMASFALGCLFGPLWRRLAERHRIHRVLEVFLAGLGAIALLFLGDLAGAGTSVGGAAGIARWAAGAAIVGVSCSGVVVLSGVFATDRSPRRDWPRRHGVAVQACAVGVGSGLLLAGAFSGAYAADGLVFGALLLVMATGMLVVWLPWMPSKRQRDTRGQAADLDGHPVVHQAHDRSAIWRGDERWHVALALFLAGTWLLTTASAALLFQFPLLVPTTFGLDPGAGAAVLGLAALASVIWYPAVGRTARTRDPVDLTIRATWMRGVVVGELALLSLLVDPWVTVVAASLFFVYRNTWPSVHAGVTEVLAAIVPPEHREVAFARLAVALAAGAVSAGLLSGVVMDAAGGDALLAAVFGITLLAGFAFSALRIWRRHLDATTWA